MIELGDSFTYASKRRAVLFGGLVALIGLLELGAHWFFSQRAPNDEAWRRLRPALERVVVEQGGGRGFQPGNTLVLVAPRWAEPMARLSLGDRWMPLSHVGRPDDEGFLSAVEISIVGATEAHPGWREDWVVTSGKFTLRGLVNSNPVPVLYDFVGGLNPSAVAVRARRIHAGKPPGRERECRYGLRKVSNGDLHGHATFPAKRFACGGGDWHFVGVTVIEDQQYRPRQCVWAHPAQGEELVIRYEGVPLGAKIRGYGGLPYFRERQSHGSPIQMRVYVEDRPVGQYWHKDGEGFTGFEFSTKSWQQSTGSVEFRVTAERAAHREFCFQAVAQ